MPLTFLDFGKPKPFGATIGKARKLAWPANVYRVTFPRPLEEGEGINPFERVILHVIEAAGLRDAGALAQETCIPVDLVRCVLLRLQGLGFLDEYNQIISESRDSWAGADLDPREFVTACVFRELATGKILPYVHFLEQNPLQKKEEESRPDFTIRWDNAHRGKPPTPLDVVSALRGKHRRSIAFGNECRLPPVQLITIAEDAEVCHLECPIALQKSDGEFRVADPFGTGFSLMLEGALTRLLERDDGLQDWMMKWKTNLSNRVAESQAEAHEEPYETNANWARYPKLVSSLRIRGNRPYRTIEMIFAALEWALYYCCVQRPYSSVVQLLKMTAQVDHPALLQRAAEELSLELPPGGMFPIGEWKLNDFLEGEAELPTVLSLSLLLAEGDVSHPLRRIAASQPDVVLRLLRLKKTRDESGHGVGRVRTKDIQLPEETFMREFVSTLLPSIRFSISEAAPVDQNRASDALLDARTSIQAQFGFHLFNRLGIGLQDRLIIAEQFWLSCKDDDNALAFACDLYAIMQSTFRLALSGRLPPDIENSDYVSAAQQNAQRLGFGDLPQCMRTVKRSAVCETLLGNDQSLQSCFVAFLLVSSDDTLKAIAQTQPAFMADVARVIDCRGHGNEPVHMSREGIGGLRKSAYTTISTLLEA